MSDAPQTVKVRVKITAARANLAAREIELALSFAMGDGPWSLPRWEVLQREHEGELTDEQLREMAEGTANLNGVRLAEEVGRE